MSDSVNLIFENQTGEEAFVHFLNGAFGPGQTGADGRVPLEGNTPYSFDQLMSTVPEQPSLGEVANVSLNDFTNGRIYFSLGKPLQGLGKGYQPASSNPKDPNYTTRWEFIEPNVFGNSSNNLDLSYIDFFGISLDAETYKDGKPLHTLSTAESSAIIPPLAALSGGKALVGSTLNSPFEGFVRVIGPGHNAHYHTWVEYLNALASKGTKAHIGGNFAGVGGSTDPKQMPQAYRLTASCHTDDKVTLDGACKILGDLRVTISYADLNAYTGVYGCNPPYVYKVGAAGEEVRTKGIENDVIGEVVGDFLAGLNMGFIGNKNNNPATGTSFADSTSSEWFAGAKMNHHLMFAPKDHHYYNDYASILNATSDGYNFPFSDRVLNPLIHFGPKEVDYIKITLK